MSNIIDGIDIGMGYEEATNWEPGLTYWHTKCPGKWQNSTTTSQTDMDRQRNGGPLIYRRKLPILANHPEAIPLEPGEVLQVGDRGLTRNSYDTGPLRQSTNDKAEKGYTLFSCVLQEEFNQNGKCSNGASCVQDIIARLPKVAKEAEQAKEEKVIDGFDAEELEEFPIELAGYRMGRKSVRIDLHEAARIAQLPEVVAEVEKQRKEKEIGPGDWFVYQNTVYRCDRIGVTGTLHVGGYGFAKERSRKITDPDLIAALNKEIDAKAGG